jgi:hypothetical protein
MLVYQNIACKSLICSLQKRLLKLEQEKGDGLPSFKKNTEARH